MKRQHVGDYLQKEEIRALVTPSDLLGLRSLVLDWLLIALAFVMVARWGGVLTVCLALVIIGGRQLGLAVLMHECAHRSLFRTRALNDWVGHWLCGAPTWNHLADYRQHHMAHHTHTNTEKDTDLGLVAPFPITRASLARKLARDLSGIAGLRRIGALLLIDFGFLTYTASTGAERIDQKGRGFGDVLLVGARRLGPVLLTNLCLAGILAASGHARLYLLWIASWLTTYGLFIRIRAIAEHACTEQSTDPFRNTRTTYAGPLARLTIAPHHVNYHLEHHLLMTVPHYHLAKMHALLKARGALEESPIAPGYRAVLAVATGG